MRFRARVRARARARVKVREEPHTARREHGEDAHERAHALLLIDEIRADDQIEGG